MIRDTGTLLGVPPRSNPVDRILRRDAPPREIPYASRARPNERSFPEGPEANKTVYLYDGLSLTGKPGLHTAVVPAKYSATITRGWVQDTLTKTRLALSGKENASIRSTTLGDPNGSYPFADILTPLDPRVRPDSATGGDGSGWLPVRPSDVERYQEGGVPFLRMWVEKSPARNGLVYQQLLKGTEKHIFPRVRAIAEAFDPTVNDDAPSIIREDLLAVTKEQLLYSSFIEPHFSVLKWFGETEPQSEERLVRLHMWFLHMLLSGHQTILEPTVGSGGGGDVSRRESQMIIAYLETCATFITVVAVTRERDSRIASGIVTNDAEDERMTTIKDSMFFLATQPDAIMVMKLAAANATLGRHDQGGVYSRVSVVRYAQYLAYVNLQWNADRDTNVSPFTLSLWSLYRASQTQWTHATLPIPDFVIDKVGTAADMKATRVAMSDTFEPRVATIRQAAKVASVRFSEASVSVIMASIGSVTASGTTANKPVRDDYAPQQIDLSDEEISLLSPGALDRITSAATVVEASNEVRKKLGNLIYKEDLAAKTMTVVIDRMREKAEATKKERERVASEMMLNEAEWVKDARQREGRMKQILEEIKRKEAIRDSEYDVLVDELKMKKEEANRGAEEQARILEQIRLDAVETERLNRENEERIRKEVIEKERGEAKLQEYVERAANEAADKERRRQAILDDMAPAVVAERARVSAEQARVRDEVARKAEKEAADKAKGEAANAVIDRRVALQNNRTVAPSPLRGGTNRPVRVLDPVVVRPGAGRIRPAAAADATVRVPMSAADAPIFQVPADERPVWPGQPDMDEIYGDLAKFPRPDVHGYNIKYPPWDCTRGRSGFTGTTTMNEFDPDLFKLARIGAEGGNGVAFVATSKRVGNKVFIMKKTTRASLQKEDLFEEASIPSRCGMCAKSGCSLFIVRVVGHWWVQNSTGWTLYVYYPYIKGAHDFHHFGRVGNREEKIRREAILGTENPANMVRLRGTEAGVQMYESIVVQCIRSVGFLQWTDYVHGDLKPANMIFTPPDPRDGGNRTVLTIDTGGAVTFGEVKTGAHPASTPAMCIPLWLFVAGQPLWSPDFVANFKKLYLAFDAWGLANIMYYVIFGELYMVDIVKRVQKRLPNRPGLVSIHVVDATKLEAAIREHALFVGVLAKWRNGGGRSSLKSPISGNDIGKVSTAQHMWEYAPWIVDWLLILWGGGPANPDPLFRVLLDVHAHYGPIPKTEGAPA
jgi:hypothetical protein